MAGPIRFGMQAGVLADGRTFLDLARKAEDRGLHSFFVADHPGVTASPFACLSAAAMVTSTLRLGTYVCNTGVRDPVQLACDAATLDVLSNGRCTLGVGAGHTPAEWTMCGRDVPSASARVARFVEMIEVVSRLLAGEVVSFDGEHVQTDEAFLLAPRPVQDHLPILVGGNGMRLLRATAGFADIVGLTGLGQTLADGHRHAADWSAASITERVALLRQLAPDPDALVIDALVQHVEITDDAIAAADRVATKAPGLTPNDVLGAPYALIGSTEQIADQVLEYRDRWGITSYVVREDAIDAVTAIIARLARESTQGTTRILR